MSSKSDRDNHANQLNEGVASWLPVHRWARRPLGRCFRPGRRRLLFIAPSDARSPSGTIRDDRAGLEGRVECHDWNRLLP